MAIVIDASVTASWLLPDEKNDLVSLLADNKLSAPVIWWYEIRNLLIINKRNNRISNSICQEALSILERLPIIIDNTPNGRNMISISETHSLTIYDAAYLELAIRSKSQLATFDKQLIAAAESEGVALIQNHNH